MQAEGEHDPSATEQHAHLYGSYPLYCQKEQLNTVVSITAI